MNNKSTIAMTALKVTPPRNRYRSTAKKFSQSYPSTTLYRHVCKFTGKPFLTPLRRVTYSPEGERLKAEQDRIIKQSATLVSKVYFYTCCMTGKAFTSRVPHAKTSPEGFALLKEKDRHARKEYLQRNDVKERELTRHRINSRTPKHKAWMAKNKEKLNEQAKERYRKVEEAKPETCRVYFRQCPITEQWFTARSSQARYTAQGRDIVAKQRVGKPVDASKYLTQARHKYESEFVAKTKDCKHCGNSFVTIYKYPYKHYCSCDCSFAAQAKAKRENKSHRNRARHFGVAHKPFNPLAVLERDKWKCKLCGIKTPKRLRGTTKPNAPELDHIMPLSKGGPHTIGNVQCLCRQCNGRKGDKIMGQLSILT